MAMKTRILRSTGLAIVTASLLLAGCGGGSSNDPEPSGSGGTASPTPGVWKGTITSTTTGLASPVVALTGNDGHSVWMSSDGRVWSGQLPLHGDRFDATFSAHMHEGLHFPDGTSHGLASMEFERHSTTGTSGRHSGCGDQGSFNMSHSPMWDRPAALATVAGVYTRSTSSGYTMTMAIGANGQFTANDSRGCVINGTIGVPDATHNMYGMDATVSSCGSLDGHYQGMGTLLDADAMQDWMTAMHPLEHGGHSHGGSHMGGHNTVPSGHHNLFMFSMVNGQGAIMDAMAR